MINLDCKSKNILTFFFENQRFSFSIKELIDDGIINNKNELIYIIDNELIKNATWSFKNSISKYTITEKGIDFYNNKYIKHTQIPTQPVSNNYNINNVSNSIIGNQQNAVINITTLEQLEQEIEKHDDSDKPLLYELCELLKEIINNNISINKGTFSKFKDVFIKLSPIAVTVGQLLVSHLVGGK